MFTIKPTTIKQAPYSQVLNTKIGSKESLPTERPEENTLDEMIQL